MTKIKLAQPGLMYNGGDPDRYTEFMRGQSWSTKMRQALAQYIMLENTICYINELSLEQQTGLQNRVRTLFISPFILLHMLEFLCSRHDDPTRAQEALDDLQAIVHREQGVLVQVVLKDISWEILGICQQISGNHLAALYSFYQSLTPYTIHGIQSATRQRIQDLYSIPCTPSTFDNC